MMEAKNIIAAFLQVLDTQPYIFNPETTNDLSAIKQTLKELENQPLQAAAEAIVEWCKKYPDDCHMRICCDTWKITKTQLLLILMIIMRDCNKFAAS